MSKSWTNDSYESIRFNESVQDVQDLFANQSKKQTKNDYSEAVGKNFMNK